LNRLEDRVTPAATLIPSLETAIVNGLNSIANTMDTIDTFGQFASNLPVVGQSIGNVLDFGKRFKDELLTPVQTYFATNDPTSTTTLVSALNTVLDGAGSPIDLVDESTASLIKIRVKGFSFSETKEDLKIDFGPVQKSLGLDLGAQLDFTPKVDFGIMGGVGFAFGYDLTPGKSAAEAFFIDVTGSSLKFSVETPFAGQGTPAPLDFKLNLGMLGSVQVDDGSIDLNANLSVTFPDPVMTMQELTGSSLASLITVSASGNLAVNLPISATLAGVNVGSAEVKVTLSGDVFGKFDINVDVNAATPDIAQAFRNFANMTPGDVVGSLSELANNLQALVSQFNLPSGIPFVEDALAGVIDFATRVQDLTSAIQDLGLQGGVEVLFSALTSPATFDVVVDGVTTSISIPTTATDLTKLATEVNNDLGVGSKVEAVIEEGRLVVREKATAAIQKLTFANVNSVAQAALGFANDQAGIPFFDFINFQEFESAVNDFLPGFTIKYDKTTQAVNFDLDLAASYARNFELNFGKDINLGGLATLSLFGRAEADLDVDARLRLSAGFDLTPLSNTSKLTDLNGGVGMGTSKPPSPAADINVTLADKSVFAIDLDTLAAGATIGDLIALIKSKTSNKLDVKINFTQDGLNFIDTTKPPGSTDPFLVAAAPDSRALVDLGFGVGAGDTDHDGKIEGGGIISRFFLIPFDTGTGKGSMAAAGIEASATDLRLGAALSVLQVAITGGTTTPVKLAARGALVDPDSSGRLYLSELISDPAGAVDVGFGKFAGADLTGAFTGIAKNDTLGAFNLSLSLLDTDTYGIDLGGDLAKVSVQIFAKDVTGLIPALDFKVDVDTGALPNFSDILKSFQNLSIDKIIGLVAGIVGKFQDFPLFQFELPLLDQSIGDLIKFVEDKVSTLLGDFNTMRADLETLLENTLDALRNQADTLMIAGHSLSDALVAIGAERQERLFHTLDDIIGAVQSVPADFDIRFDTGQALVTRVAGAFRAMRELITEIVDDVVPSAPSATAIVEFFTKKVASVPALASKSFIGLIADKLPSSDRIVKLVMNAFGLSLADLTEAGSAAILDAIEFARDTVNDILADLPTLPSGDLGSTTLNDVRDAAQAALDAAEAALSETFDRLEAAVNNLDVFAAVRAVQHFVEALGKTREAVEGLIANGNAVFNTAIADLNTMITSLISDVRDKIFTAFPLGAITFSMPDQETLMFNLHVSRPLLDQKVDVQFDLDDAGLPDIVPLDVEASITGGVDIVADFNFGIGFDLDKSSSTFLQPFFDRDSEISLTADVDLTVDGSASVGGFTMKIVGGVIKLKDVIDLGGDGKVGGGDDDYGNPAKLGLTFNDPTPGDKGVFFADIVSGGLSVFQPILTADLLVNLPIEIPSKALGPISLHVGINNFSEFNVTDFTIPPDLITEIINGLTELSLANIIAGVRLVFDNLIDGLQSDLIGQLPLIGDDLNQLGEFLDKFNTEFLDPLETFLDSLAGSAPTILTGLKNIIYNTLGPGPSGSGGLNFLILDKTFGGDDTATTDDESTFIDPSDVPVTFTGADINAPMALTKMDAGYEFDLTFGFSKDFSLPLDFSLSGLGLGISGNPEIIVRINPEFKTSFGLNRLQGFYVNLDNTSGQTNGSLDLDVYLKSDSKLDLKLFFLNLGASVTPIEDFNHNGTATDKGLDEDADQIDYNQDGTISGKFDEPGDKNGDGHIAGGVGFFGNATLSFGKDKLFFGDMGNFKPSFKLDTKMDADITFKASLDGQQAMPSVSAGLNVDWTFGLDKGKVSNSINVDYTGITIDLGDFFRDNIAPVIEAVNQYFSPLQKIFDVINSEIPVISDLSKLLGQGPVTFVSLIGLLGTGGPELGKFVNTLSKIADLVDTIGDIADDLGDGIIEFGDLKLGSTIDVSDPGAKSKIKTFNDAKALTSKAGDILAQLGSAGSKVTDLESGKFSSSVGVTNGAFHFPVFSDPFGTVAGFLLGQTKDLVVWDLPDFVAEFSFSYLFGPIIPPIPIFAKIFGSFRFATDFAVGFDTRGIQQSFADFYKGFYFRDFADTLKADGTEGHDGILGPGETTEARELGLDMEFGAGAELNIVVASAGVEGGIHAAITADWNDVLKDGKFYVDELVQRLSQGLECIFELSGKLDAFLRAYVKIGFDTPFGFVTLFKKSLNLVNVTLLDFSVSCPPLPIPQPGSGADADDATDSNVLLNIGPRAGSRQPGATDVAEIVEVFGERDHTPGKNIQFPAAITDSDGDGDIDSDDVTAFIDGGGSLPADIDVNADDMIDTDEARLFEDFNANGTIGTTDDDKQSILLIGFGQWQLFRNSAIKIIGDGGLADDQIILDHSVQIPSELNGGSGKDKLHGGLANDIIYGDGGASGGSPEADVIYGDFGDDEIHGGSFDDEIYGNAGNDTIFGDDGNDAIAGDDGTKLQPIQLLLNGKPAAGNPLVSLSSLNDAIHGNGGEDAILGEFGDDNMFGESGPDVMAGGWGDDTMDGGADPDLLEGNEGSDDVFGQGGNDLIFGEADGISTANDGDDFMDGGTENDTIRDDRGIDTAIGGFHDDFITTGVGNDIIFGDLDPRVGGAPPAGTNGVDIIFGDRDVLPTIDDGLGFGNGADYIEGGGNKDTIHGGAGGDRIIGGGSPFSGVLFGGTDDDDLIFGEDGDDIIAGDNATIGKAGDISSIGDVTTFAEGGAGIDIVFGSAGADKIFGGGKGDKLNGDDSGGTDNDIVVGDQGTFTAVLLEALHSGIANSGGQDFIQGFDGHDILLGGDDNDTIFGHAGDDVVTGDNGTVTFKAAVVVRVATRDEAFGGDDLINGDQGADIVFGGTGDDNITGGGVVDVRDIIFGDNGEVVLQDGSADENDLFSTDPTLGGVDTVFGGADDDFIVGGSGGKDTAGKGGDTLNGQDGNDVMMGDNARINRTSGATPSVEFIKSIFTSSGGDDKMFGNSGKDIAGGGAGADEMEGNENDDILVGDNVGVFFVDDPGSVEVEGDADVTALDLIRSFTDGLGATDMISGNSGADVGIGGTAGDFMYGDNVTASAGTADLADIMLGDNGDVTLLKLSLFPGPGSNAITVLGGTVAVIRTTDTATLTGGIDMMSGNADGDIMAGGVLGDTMHGDAATPGAFDGGDSMLGDNGRLEWLYQGDAAFAAIEAGLFFDKTLNTLDLITTELPISHPGGRDTMNGNGGDDVMFGGEDTDTMHGNTSQDVMFGDHGRIYPQHSTLAKFASRNFFSIDTGNLNNGAGDRMFGDDGADVMLGQQGDDRMFGGSGDDDMIGGHNVAGGFDELTTSVIDATLNPPVNDLMDGGTDDDAMAGDNAIIWRRGDDNSPRFRTLNSATIYSTNNSTINVNVGSTAESDPDDAVGRDIQLLDHSDAVQANPQGRFGTDIMAGGADSDVMFGQLGNDLMQGDGTIGADDLDTDTITRHIVVTDSGSNPDTDEDLFFNIGAATADADDYMEGNGGDDLMYGGLGQDDMIGGNSDLFGLNGPESMRPDGSDTIFGGVGTAIGRNDVGNPTSLGHVRDADFIMGDNAVVYRLVAGGDLFQTFAYDNYGGGRIVPRAMQQLDYTLGGADYAGGSYVNGVANADNGAADLIYGEDGDDVMFGMTASDVMFGNAHDDDAVGGYGHDWVSGGTGQDGILGDDGIISTSRNGTPEPLYGIAATSQKTISTPGTIQFAIINVPGDLKKTIDITPFSFDKTWNAKDDEFPDNSGGSPFADDIIFGGLGSDFLHGGSGDDAISGAEALAQAFVPVYDTDGNPTGVVDLGYSTVNLSNSNPGDVLAFNPDDIDGKHPNNRFRPGEFRLYDEYDPLRKVLLTKSGELSSTGTGFEFLLNFDKSEGVARAGGNSGGNGNQSVPYDAVNDDGSDAIFGDLGNDWIVGGTGRDNMYGGWGNDMLNADDDQTTNGTLNDAPDTHPTYEDRAYGGAGRDVLIANTGGDRLIDWVGEYNSYLVPYAPFGMASVSRTLQPQLTEFLYQLSAADGADPTRATDTGSDPLRNGEPAGELGLVRQQDFAWQDQTGPPSDPQAGNIPGGKRDVLRSADFNNQKTAAEAGFFPDSGIFEIYNGALQVSASSPNSDAVSVFQVNSYLPNYYELVATISTLRPTGGWKANAYVIFDYFSPTDFKFAGVDISINKVVIGYRDASGWNVVKQVPRQLKAGTYYNMLIAVNGTTVSVSVDNQALLTHVFPPRIIDGASYGLNQGMVGVGSDNARGNFDNVAAQMVPPANTFTHQETFNDGVANLFTGETTGNWETVVVGGNGRHSGTPSAGQSLAINSVDLGVAGRLQTASYLELTTRFKTATAGGVFFDRYANDEFKFAILDIQAGRIAIGHMSARHGWVVDETVPYTLSANVDYILGVSIKGSTVSVSINGQTVLGHVFNSVAVDGGFGLLTRDGTSSFDEVTIRTNDPVFANAPPMLAEHENTAISTALADATAPELLDERVLVPLLDEALRRWSEITGQAIPSNSLRIAVAELNGNYLGQTHGSTIYIDADAAGYGWYIDGSPSTDIEFLRSGDQGEQGRMDLLTVVMHEVGHTLGFDHDHGDVMSETLVPGIRITFSGPIGGSDRTIIDDALTLIPADDSSEVNSTLTITEPVLSTRPPTQKTNVQRTTSFDMSALRMRFLDVTSLGAKDDNENDSTDFGAFRARFGVALAP